MPGGGPNMSIFDWILLNPILGGAWLDYKKVFFYFSTLLFTYKKLGFMP